MVLPEIPGRIIAQIAIRPDKNMENKESDSGIGFIRVIIIPKNNPTKKNEKSNKFLAFKFLNIKKAEKNINPKKREKICIG